VTPWWLADAQARLVEFGLDGWLIYDFRGSNPFAARFIDLGDGIQSRRVFTFVPREGRPVALVSVLEAGSLRVDGFEIRSYDGRASLESQLAALLPGGRIAMEYSPHGDIPYVSTVDAGTLQLVAGVLDAKGGEVVSSADLLQAFAAWTPKQITAHRSAAMETMAVLEDAWTYLRDAIEAGRVLREVELQDHIARAFLDRGLTFAHRAIVGFGPNGGNPHYVPRVGEDRTLEPGDPILIDLFARLPEDGAPHADVTWMGVYGDATPAFERAWLAVRDARRLGVQFLRDAFEQGRLVQGFEVDRAVRAFLTEQGYGEAFVHRTGHSLGSLHTHGEAVHFDDFETHDTRLLRPGIGVTIEPGVYLPEFGVRSELDVLMTDAGPEVTTGEQDHLVRVPLGPLHR